VSTRAGGEEGVLLSGRMTGHCKTGERM